MKSIDNIMFKINIFIIVAVIFIGLLFANEYYEKNNKTYDASNLIDAINSDIDNIEEDLLSENLLGEVEFDIIENPKNDEELALNLIREHFAKVQKQGNVFVENLAKLRIFSVFEDNGNTELKLLELDFSDIEEDFLKAVRLVYENDSNIKNNNEKLLLKARSNYFNDRHFEALFIKGFKEGLIRADVTQSRLVDINIEICRLQAELLKTLKNCMDDWYTEETESGYIANFDNIEYDDQIKLAEIADRIEKLELEAMELGQKALNDSRKYINP